MTIGNLPESDAPAPLDDDVRARMSKVLGHRQFDCFRVGGVQSLNNDVRLLVTADGQRLAVRLASARGRNHLGVDPLEEGAIASLAGVAGIGPRVVHAGTDGLLVTEWINGARPLAADGFADALRRRAVIDLVRRLHELDLPSGPGPARSIFERIAALEASALAAGRAGMPERHRQKLTRLKASAQSSQRPTHHDLWPNNVLDDGERLWLVDWEFSGCGDGVYDLACIAVSAGLDPDEERAMLVQAGRPSGDHDWLSAMKWVARYFEASWGLVMAGLGASATDGTGQAFDYGAHAARMIARLDD